MVSTAAEGNHPSTFAMIVSTKVPINLGRAEGGPSKRSPVIGALRSAAWLWEALQSVGEQIPGHPLSVGESSREGGECRREREAEPDDRLQRETESESE